MVFPGHRKRNHTKHNGANKKALPRSKKPSVLSISNQVPTLNPETPRSSDQPLLSSNNAGSGLPLNLTSNIRLIRYRLAVGYKHEITLDSLVHVLAEESGADKNNIRIIQILDEYTLIELPDKMPQDIFLHLKSVEINNSKLNIKRIKVRRKKYQSQRRNQQPPKSSPS